jgi:hypothetical protein
VGLQLSPGTLFDRPIRDAYVSELQDWIGSNQDLQDEFVELISVKMKKEKKHIKELHVQERSEYNYQKFSSKISNELLHVMLKFLTTSSPDNWSV